MSFPSPDRAVHVGARYRADVKHIVAINGERYSCLLSSALTDRTDRMHTDCWLSDSTSLVQHKPKNKLQKDTRKCN